MLASAEKEGKKDHKGWNRENTAEGDRCKADIVGAPAASRDHAGGAVIPPEDVNFHSAYYHARGEWSTRVWKINVKHDLVTGVVRLSVSTEDRPILIACKLQSFNQSINQSITIKFLQHQYFRSQAQWRDSRVSVQQQNRETVP